MNANAETDSRWYQVMTSLLYPAVLGTILYTLGDAAWTKGFGLFTDSSLATLVEGSLGVALVLLFSFDYAYTLNDNAGQDYGPWQFALDTAALVLLFLAGKVVTTGGVTSASTPLPVLLLAVKLLALLYEISRLPSDRGSRSVAAAWLKYDSDGGLVLVYLAVACAWLLLPAAWPGLLVAGMLLDAASYFRRIT